MFLFLAIPSNSFAGACEPGTVTNEDGSSVQTFCNEDGSYGGQVVNSADGSSQQFDSNNQLMGGWGGGQDAYRVNYTPVNGRTDLVDQVWTRTGGDGQEYNGGFIRTNTDPNATGPRNCQHDSDGNQMSDCW